MSNEKEKRQKEALSQPLYTLEGKPIRIDVNHDEDVPTNLKELLLWICSKNNPKADGPELSKTYAVAKKLHKEEIITAEDIVHIQALLPAFVKNPIIFGVCMDQLEML